MKLVLLLALILPEFSFARTGREDCYQHPEHSELRLACYTFNSQEAPRAVDRAIALSLMSHDFQCDVNPDMIPAMLYALRDAVEDVRRVSIEQLGRQLSAHSSCCSSEIKANLTTALGDAIYEVRTAAQDVLSLCP